jgi:hypothetical protein
MPRRCSSVVFASFGVHQRCDHRLAVVAHRERCQRERSLGGADRVKGCSASPINAGRGHVDRQFPPGNGRRGGGSVAAEGGLLRPAIGEVLSTTMERAGNIAQLSCCMRVARGFWERVGMLGNPPFLCRTDCNTLRARERRPKAPEMPDFIGFFRWRPEAESNRCTRICSPLHSHSAIRPGARHIGLGPPRGQGERCSADCLRPSATI